MWTVCPDNARANPFGVPWSKRMSTGGNGVGAQALSHELEHGRHLLARHVELLDDLVDAEILEVLDDRGDGQTRALEHPGAAHLAGDALDGRALGPVKRLPLFRTPSSRLRQNALAVTRAHAASRSPASTSRHLVPTREILPPSNAEANGTAVMASLLVM